VPLVPRYSLLGAAWALLGGLLTLCAGFTLALTFALRPRRAELSPVEADARR